MRFRSCRAWALLLLAALPTDAARGQTAPAGEVVQAVETPEAVAVRFYGAFQSARWGALAATLDPEALDRFRFQVGSVLRSDAGEAIAENVFGRPPDEVMALGDADLVAGLVEGIVGYARGMMEALMTKDVQVLGHVLEDAPDDRLAHVVTRSREPLSGTAPSTVDVLTLSRQPDGWRVRWSQELDVVVSALVAAPRTRRQP